MPALAARPWTSQVPQTGDPDTDRYASELAAAMDDRQRRLGEHAAEHPPAWAHGLGPVPEHPLDRADWEHRAGQVAAYREMWGYTHPHRADRPPARAALPRSPRLLAGRRRSPGPAARRPDGA